MVDMNGAYVAESRSQYYDRIGLAGGVLSDNGRVFADLSLFTVGRPLGLIHRFRAGGDLRLGPLLFGGQLHGIGDAKRSGLLVVGTGKVGVCHDGVCATASYGGWVLDPIARNPRAIGVPELRLGVEAR